MVLNVENCMNFSSKQELEAFKLHIEEIIKLISYKNFTGREKSSEAMYIDVIKASLYIIQICIALFGNSLIIAVICFNRFLWKPTNYYILNLAICDLAIVLSCMWVQIVIGFNENWVLGQTFCKLNSYMQMVSIIASVLTLSAIAYDRYQGIVHPFRSRGSTNSKCYMIIAIIWVLSFVISIPTYVYRTYRELSWSDYTEKSCDDHDWPYELQRDTDGCVKKTWPEKRIYYTTVILLLFFLPILIMLIAYSIVITKLWKSEIIGEGGQIKDNRVSQRRKSVVMLIWVLTVFFICWFPIETMLLFMEYTLEFPKLWRDLEWIAYFMAYSNAAINPVIYAGLNQNFRSGMKKLKSFITKSKASRHTSTFKSKHYSQNRSLPIELYNLNK